MLVGFKLTNAVCSGASDLSIAIFYFIIATPNLSVEIIIFGMS